MVPRIVEETNAFRAQAVGIDLTERGGRHTAQTKVKTSQIYVTIKGEKKRLVT
jgi:hypothetical protein